MAKTVRGLPEIRWEYMPARQCGKTDRLEREFAAEAIAALRAAGWFCAQVENQKRVKSGFSDWVCIRRGRVVFLEFKTPKGRQRPEQVAFMNEVRAHGGEYRVARQWHDIEDMIGKVACND